MRLIQKQEDKEDLILSVFNLTISFQVEGKMNRVVDQVSFSVFKGKTLGIIGESGSGKSVTALSILRLAPLTNGKIESGEIYYNKKNLLKISDQEIRSIRGNTISIVFQEPMTSLNPVLTIGDQVLEVIQIHKKNLSKKEARERSLEMLRSVKIPSFEKRALEYPHQLSGGMRQRVMIAMALACDPQILIADEPTTALDVTIQAQILDLLCELQEKTGMAMILITHDFGVVLEMADYVAVMRTGKIIEQASTREIFTSPQSLYTQQLLKHMYDLNNE